jgi:1-acyl-sn-glycerol-3-phosphate acyltransferase
VSVVYAVLRGAAVVLFRMLARWRVETLAPLPSGPLIVVCNHLSLVDPPLLAASLPRRLRFLAKRELFSSPALGLFVRASQSIPLGRRATDREALAHAEAHLRSGGVLAIFPEGQRSPNGLLQPGKAGVGYLALRTGAPLVPVAMTGTERLRRPWRVFTRPVLKVRVGEPFAVGGPVERPGRTAAQACTDAIMERIAALLPEARRGAYGRCADEAPAPQGAACERGASHGG